MILRSKYFADTAFWIALFRTREQYHREAMLWQAYVTKTQSLIITTEAVCWEWLPHSVSEKTVALFSARFDGEWTLTDCLSFTVMAKKNVREALTADSHFDQAGFQAILESVPPIC